MSGNDSGITAGYQQTFYQNNVREAIAVNEANAESIFDTENDDNDSGNENLSSEFDSFPKELNEDKQGKHIPGHKNFQNGKSMLTISMSEASALIEMFSGKGKPISDTKERVDFGKTIGIYRDPLTGEETPTSVGIIHYSKTGTHIVPARPKEK